MLETLKQIITINFTVTLNSILYFLKRGRLTRLIFGKLGYEHEGFTQVLVVIGIIYAMIDQLFKSTLLACLSILVPFLIIGNNYGEVTRQDIFWQMFLIFYVLLSLTKDQILSADKKKYICVRLMKMDAKKYVIADYFPKIIWRQLVELLVFYVVAAILSINFLLLLFFLIGKNLFGIFIEMINIRYYNKTGRFLYDKYGLLILYTIIVIALGYFTAYSRLFIELPMVSILILGTVLWILGLYSIRYILHYEHYDFALRDANRKEKLFIDMEQIKKEAAFSNVKIKDKEFSQSELQYDSSNKKEGFRFINDLFFKRHRRILNKPIRYEIYLSLILFGVGVLLLLFAPDFNTNFIKVIKSIFPVFIFALYVMSTGQRATKAMFYNCDISLLHYGFYKTKGAVLATFTIRAKHLIAANILPAGFLGIEFILLDLLSGGTGLTLVPIAVMLIVLSIFFVVHNLFLYYIFQPYTCDLNVKNPFYKFFNFITYILCYISLQLRNMSSAFLIIVVVATFVYSVAALIIVYRIAPKTFVIK